MGREYVDRLAETGRPDRASRADFAKAADRGCALRRGLDARSRTQQRSAAEPFAASLVVVEDAADSSDASGLENQARQTCPVERRAESDLLSPLVEPVALFGPGSPDRREFRPLSDSLRFVQARPAVLKVSAKLPRGD